MTCPPTWRTCRGRLRHSCAAGAVKDARRAPAPALESIAEAKRMVHAGKIDYG